MKKTEPAAPQPAEPQAESPDASLARLATESAFSATTIVTSYLGLKSDPLAMLTTLQEQARAINSGDLSKAENMLIGQAMALEAMFVDLAVRAKKAQSLQAAQCLTQLALRAQAGSRSALQALADVKNPRQVAFVRQTNVAQTQQVNNAAPSSSRSRARKAEAAPNELLVEEKNGRKKMDSRAAPAPVGVGANLVAVDTLDRAAQRRRKAERVP